MGVGVWRPLPNAILPVECWMKLLSTSHIVIGFLFFFLFLLTGGYMLVGFPALYDGREEIRMMFRATHTYILMSALVNLMAGNYLLHVSTPRFPSLQCFASVLILSSPVLLLAAFFYEPPGYLTERPVSFWGVVSLLVGVMLHTLLNFKQIIESIRV